MSDIQSYRTQRVKNTPEALAAHRRSMAQNYWRRVGMEPLENHTDVVRVRYERVFDRQTLIEEIAQEERAASLAPPSFAALSPQEQCQRLDTILADLADQCLETEILEALTFLRALLDPAASQEDR